MDMTVVELESALKKLIMSLDTSIIALWYMNDKWSILEERNGMMWELGHTTQDSIIESLRTAEMVVANRDREVE